MTRRGPHPPLEDGHRAAARSMLHGLNHITIAVRDLDRSLAFYVDLLGFEPRAKWQRGAYLTLGDLWLCLALDAAASCSDDYSHIAFSIDSRDIDRFRTLLNTHGVRIWKQNTSEGDSVYFVDPDGRRLEAHVGDVTSRLQSMSSDRYEGLKLRTQD